MLQYKRYVGYNYRSAFSVLLKFIILFFTFAISLLTNFNCILRTIFFYYICDIWQWEFAYLRGVCLLVY